MKQTISILLVLVTVLNPLSKVWIYVDFKINQDFIAKTLCIQKEVETNTCQGSCQLKQKLDEADEQEQNHSPQNIKEKAETHYFADFMGFELKKLGFVLQCEVFNRFDICFYDSSFLSKIFRPPTVLS